MNIALIHDWITNLAGAERVLLNLTEIFPGVPVYTSVYDKKVSAFKNVDVRTSFLQKYPLLKKRRELLIPLTPLAFENIDLSKFDLVISNTTMAAKGVITKPDAIHICYCHTPSRYLWEPEIDPRADSGWLTSLRKSTAHKMRIWDKVAADRPDFFIANSKYIQKRIKKYYGRDSVVVYPPVDIAKFNYDPEILPKDYYLFVSRLISYKKCDLVIEAFNKLKMPLKIIGSGPEKESLKKMAGSNIEFLGHLSDDELVRYYQEAKAFIFAAEEDFGIVPVEAMACGRPVIAFGEGGVSETVVDGETGLFFKDQTAESLIEAVKSFKPEKFDSEKIRQRAEKFSIERFKKNFIDAVEGLSGKKIPRH